MKKSIQTLITWLIVTLVLIGAIPFVKAQTSPSPQSTSSIGVPVVFDGQTLLVIQNRLGSRSIEERSQRASKIIADFADNYDLTSDSLRVTSMDEEGIPLSGIIAGSNLVIFISEQDAKSAGKTRTELANEYLQQIRSAINQYRKERSPEHLIRGVIYSIPPTIILIFAIIIVSKFFARIQRRLVVWGEGYIQAIRLGNFEIIKANQLDNVIASLTRIIQRGIILSLLIVYFLFVFKQFPWTRDLASIFWGDLLGVLNSGWQLFINYLPSLLTITLVIFFVSFLHNLARTFFKELENETISLPGFYAEWAWPTYRLVAFLMMILTAVVVFPLLPGFQSPAFQGISVFLGLLISLGSSSVIANIISGIVLIYTRAFRVGDCIKVREVYGEVIETTLFVTRILTTKNDVISIPNSVILSNSIENLNFAAKELKIPLIVKTSIFLGYEVAWREAYQALIEAALRTEGVANSPLPYILQEKLNEFHVTYVVSVYIDLTYFKGKKLNELDKISSQLNENIRDCCAEAGIRILAPIYEADISNSDRIFDPSQQ